MGVLYTVLAEEVGAPHLLVAVLQILVQGAVVVNGVHMRQEGRMLRRMLQQGQTETPTHSVVAMEVAVVLPLLAVTVEYQAAEEEEQEWDITAVLVE